MSWNLRHRAAWPLRPVTGVAGLQERPAIFRPLAAWLRRSAARARQRRALARLDDRLLADIGLTPRQARLESSRPFWRP